MLRTIGALTLAMAVGWGAADAQSGQRGLDTKTWTVDGVDRTALVAFPSGPAPSAGWPLVLVFHGHGGSSAQAARSFRIHEHWPGAVVVYPQGLPTPGQISDPQGRRAGWQSAAGAQDDRDLRFVDRMLADLRREADVDARRIFAAGHSNGGSMVYVLWRSRAAEFAAFAPSSSVFGQNLAGSPPKPALVVAGRRDALVPFRAQQRSLDGLLALNHADRTGTPWGDGLMLHRSSTGADVVTYVHDGSHQLPADAGRWMVEFFKERPAH